MDTGWALHNIRMAWRSSAGPADATRQLLLRYAGALPKGLRRNDWEIALRCAPPVGDIRLLLRDNAGADMFVYSEIFEHECYALPLKNRPATILDLGANIGLAAIYFARAFPAAQLACVEPDPDNLRVLRRNLDLNGIAAAVFAAAIHNQDGAAMMARAVSAYGHSIADERTESSAARFEVAAMTVPTLLARLGWERVGLAKIDIEGHELALLDARCDWLDCVDALCLEYHLDGGQAHLTALADRYRFAPPRQLPNGLWLMTR